MKARFEIAKLAPAGYRGLLEIERYLKTCGVEENILHMMKLRASQINGCAFCIDMHWKDLRAIGESEQRLYSLDAWRENEDLYNQRERAALAWCEALTKIAEGHAPDAVYDDVMQVFNEKEIADLTLAIGAINNWNRLAIASRMVPGLYKPAKAAAA
jgi:AhpD family alkylhydroperoxidase